MDDKILSVIKHYGVMKQLKYMSTEQFELNEAVINLDNYDQMCNNENNRKYFLKHIIEELADNLFMLKQIALYYGITDKEIEDVMNYKIDRQIKRIENETSN